MDSIIALINTKTKLIKSKHNFKSQPKLDELEALYSIHPDKSDDEICKLLYGSITKKKSFSVIKYRLLDRLITEVIMASGDESNLTSVSYAVQIAIKYYYSAAILLKNGERTSAINLLEKCLTIALKFSLTEYVVISLKILLNHYAFINVDKNKMNHYIRLRQKHLEIYQQEAIVLEYNARMSYLYVTKSGGFNDAELLDIKNMVYHLEVIKNTYTSNTILTHSYDLIFFYYNYLKSYEKALETANEALRVYKKMKVKELFGTYQMQNNIATVYFNMKEYDNANIWFEKQFAFLSVGSVPWFRTTSIYFLNLMYIKDYKKLIEISSQVLANKNLNKLTTFSEQWYIREAFIHLLIHVYSDQFKLIEPHKLKPFSSSKFMNNITFHSKDKQGQNISILVVQFLHLLALGNYEIIFDKVDALKQYTFRYLRNDNTFRSNCFIKMLLEMVRADFNPIRTERYTATLLQRLVESDIIIDDKNSRVEIIPYEDLWEIAMEILRQNMIKQNKENKKIKK